jgi:enoyl-CoA hydratase/carnithine racemase
MREMAYTGRRMYAEEAKESGLVSDTYESHENALRQQIILLKKLLLNLLLQFMD